MPIQDFLASLFGMNDDPYADDREKLRAQIERMRLEEGTFYDDTSGDRNKLRNQIGRMQLRSQIEDMQKPSWFSQTPIGQDLSKYTQDGKLQLPFEPGPAISGVAEKRNSDPYGLEGTQPTAADFGVERLKMGSRSINDEPGIDEYVTAPDPPPSTPYEDPEEYLRNYASNMDPDKLARIRAQAVAKGRQGSLSGGEATGEDFLRAAFGGGGSFSQQDESPELAMRLSERDNWAAGQDVRDAKWDVDLARMRKDPAAQESAGNRLISLKNQESADRRNKMLELIVQKVGKNGKIPYKEATTLRQLGLPIDLTMMGSDPDTVSQYFQGLQAAGGEFLSQLDPISIMEDPGLMKRADVEKKLMMLAAEYDKKLKAGYDPDEARREYERAGHNFIIANGLGNLLQIRNGQLTEASK